VIASAEKAVAALTPPVPLELLRFGARSTLRALSPAELREVPVSPDGGLIADYLGTFDDPGALAARLSSTPGVVDHGLFAPELVSLILIARDREVEHRTGGKAR
jgi:ribose 5-phosphate isomerase A